MIGNNCWQFYTGLTEMKYECEMHNLLMKLQANNCLGFFIFVLFPAYLNLT